MNQSQQYFTNQPVYQSFQYTNNQQSVQNLQYPQNNASFQQSSARPYQNRLDRAMCSSVIQQPVMQSSNSSTSFGLGKLQAMGRFIKEQNSAASHKEIQPLRFKKPQNTFGSRTDINEKTKMASSVIFFNKGSQQMNRFPLFGIENKIENNGGLTKLEGLMANKKIVEVKEQFDTQTQEERRKRQIQDIKQQADALNKKIDSSFANKPYFQLPTRKRNSPAIQNKPIQQNTNQIQNNGILKNIQQVKTPLNISQQVMPQIKAEGGMFKKKNPYISESSEITTVNIKSIQATKPVVQPYSFPNPILKKLSSTENVPRKFTKADFAIGKKMGKGQFGEVMLVQHKQTGFLCGMKVMSKKQIREEKYVNQVARELSIQFYLSHRYIAPLYGFFEDTENVYLLIEFCTDGQLLQKMRKAHRLQQHETSPIIKEVCEGIDYIHKEGIIHRDIKPQNILFQFGTVKISDFGWAVHSGNGLRRTVSGTPLYYSPELVLQTEYDEKIDIWSIGMMTYECILGKIPFRIYTELDLNRIVEDQIKFPEYVDVTDETKDFILKIMHKKPEDRMQIKQMFRHPFITKYLKEKKISEEAIIQFRRVIS